MANKLKQQAAKIKEAERKASQAAASLQKAVSAVSPQQAQRLITLLAPKAQGGASGSGHPWQSPAKMNDPVPVSNWRPAPNEAAGAWSNEPQMIGPVRPQYAPGVETYDPAEIAQAKMAQGNIAGRAVAAQEPPANVGPTHIPVSPLGMSFPRNRGAIPQALQNIQTPGYSQAEREAAAEYVRKRMTGSEMYDPSEITRHIQQNEPDMISSPTIRELVTNPESAKQQGFLDFIGYNSKPKDPVAKLINGASSTIADAIKGTPGKTASIRNKEAIEESKQKGKTETTTASTGTSKQGGLPSALSPEMQELSQRMTNAYFSDLPRHLQPVIAQDENGEEVIMLRGAFLNQYTQTMYTIGLENGRAQMLDEMNAQEFENQEWGPGKQQQQEGMQKRMVMSQPNQPVDPYSATDYYHQMQTAMSPALDPRNTFNQQVITEPDSHHEQLMLEYLEKLYPNTSREYLLQILRGR